MKIAIPLESKQSDNVVADVFGRATYFEIYDTKTQTVDYVENVGAKSPNGAGIKAAQQLIDYKVDGVILPQIGKNGADLLSEANIKLYKGKDMSVAESLALLENNELSLLEETHSGFHGGR